MGVPRVVFIFHFVFLLEGATLIGPSPSFLELWAIPKENTPLDITQNRNPMVAFWSSPPLQVIYMQVEQCP